MDATAQLHRAARDGDVVAVERTLSLAPVDHADALGDTALSLASQKGHVAVVDVLLAHGASVVGADRDGDTALMCASWHGFHAIVDRLLAAGAVVDHANNDSVTALMCAAENGHTLVVDALLAAGARVDRVDKDGDSALMCALIAGHEPVARRLVAAGADVRICNFRGETPFSRAQKKGHTKIVQLFHAFEASSAAMFEQVQAGQFGEVERLLAFQRVGDRGPHGRTLAHVAAMHGQLAILELLVDRNASVHAKDDSAWTPLHAACASGAVDCVRYLLVSGAEMDVVDLQGLAPVDIAARHGHLDVVSELHRRGVHLNNVSRSGETILHHAVVSGQSALVTFVIGRSGVDINAVDECGWTPLHYAVESGNLAITSVLLLRGGDPNRKITASRDGSDSVTDLCVFSTVLHMAARLDNPDMISILLASGRAEVNGRNADGETPLFLAVSMGSYRAAATLIQLGADTKATNYSGETVLSKATQRKDETMRQLLLAHNAGATSQPSHLQQSHNDLVVTSDPLDALVVQGLRGSTALDLLTPENELQTSQGMGIDRTDDESDPTAHPTREEMRCQYRGGKKCSEPRTTKINGTLHKLCHSHRMKQNEKKRRSSTKRKHDDGHHDSLPEKRGPLHQMVSDQCQYGGRPCSQMRDLKPNGERHLFCAFHRRRHNANQKKVDGRRRDRPHQEIHGTVITG